MKAPEPKAKDYANMDLWKKHKADEKPVPFVINEEPTRGEYGFEFPITIDGTEKSVITIKDDNRKYATLYKAFGGDFEKWVGPIIHARIREITSGKYEGEEELVFIIKE